MKHYRICLAIAILLLASLACQVLGRGSENGPATTPASKNTGSTPANPEGNADTTVNTEFPMTSDAYNVTEAGGSLIFFTKLSLKDVMKFYRDQYASKGYTERENLTVTSDTTLSMVFDGDPSGKSVVVQSVDIGDGSRTVSIRLEDIQ